MDRAGRSGWFDARPVLMTALVPIVAAAGILTMAIYGKRSGNVAEQPSMAAFDACLTAKGLQPAGRYPSQIDASVAAQEQFQACGDKIPKAYLEREAAQASAERRAAVSSFRQCVESMGGSHRSFGFGRRFQRGPSQGFRNAVAACRALLEGASGGTEKPPAKPPSGGVPGPVA
jgi:hypothetical protein